MPRHILICDDEVHILRAAEFKLKKAGYLVTCAADGLEAWELIRQSPPDLLVTDCHMPRLDGLTLAARLRDNPATEALPVVILSAKGYELSRLRNGECDGMAAVISKPFSPRELLRCIEQILETGVYTGPVTTL